MLSPAPNHANRAGNLPSSADVTDDALDDALEYTVDNPSLHETAPDETAPDESALDENRPSLSLSATQICAGVAAAVTAAILGSRLGVAGTVLGAAVASAVSMVASALYSHSIARTRWRVKQAIKAKPKPLPTDLPRLQHTQRLVLADRELPQYAQPLVSADPQTRPVGAPRTSRPRTPLFPRRPMARGLLLGAMGAVSVFVAALVLITGVEAVKGAPLAGGTVGGLTVLGGRSGEPAAVAPPDGTGPIGGAGATVTISRDDNPSSDLANGAGAPRTTGSPQTSVLTATVTVTTEPSATGSNAPATTGGASGTQPPSASSVTQPGAGTTGDQPGSGTAGGTAATSATQGPTPSGGSAVLPPNGTPPATVGAVGGH